MYQQHSLKDKCESNIESSLI